MLTRIRSVVPSTTHNKWDIELEMTVTQEQLNELISKSGSGFIALKIGGTK